MEAKHTPGPREVTQHADGSFNVYTDSGPETSGADEILIGYGFRNRSDAELDAAAPDMLAALSYIDEQTFPDRDNGEIDDSVTLTIEVTIGWLREVRDAVAKAAGNGRD